MHIIQSLQQLTKIQEAEKRMLVLLILIAVIMKHVNRGWNPLTLLTSQESGFLNQSYSSLDRVVSTSSNCSTTILPVGCVCCSWYSLNASPYPGSMVNMPKNYNKSMHFLFSSLFSSWYFKHDLKWPDI